MILPPKPNQTQPVMYVTYLSKWLNFMMWFVMQAPSAKLVISNQVQQRNQRKVLFTWLWLYLQYKYVCVYVISEWAFIWRLLFANVCWLR